MIRVAAVGGSFDHHKNPQPAHIKYYNNRVNKEKVKEDFDIILDKEISKLRVDILV